MMKEEAQVNTYTDSPCKDFRPHRFKTSHCVHCFKPKSSHTQDSLERSKRKSANLHVIEVNSNNKIVSETGNSKSVHRKCAARTNINNNTSFGKTRQLEDGVLDRSMLAGKTRQLRKQFESQAVTTQQQQQQLQRRKTVNMNDKNKNSAMCSNREPRGREFVMNVPIKPNIESDIKDLNSNSNHNSAINDHYESEDSDSEVLAEPTRFWSKCKPTRAMDRIPSRERESPMSDHSDGSDGYVDLADDDYVDLVNNPNIPVLKSIHSQRGGAKSSSDSSPDELQQIEGHRMKEMQQAGKQLRHVDPPHQDSPTVKRRPVKTYCPKPVLPTNANNAAAAAHISRPESSKREQLAANNGNKVEAIYSVTQKKKCPPVDASKLDLAGKPVTIKYRDGSVLHYDGSRPSHTRSGSDKGVIESGSTPVKSNNNPEHPSAARPKPYVVVDISTESPKGLSTRDRRSISGPSLPCTPSPRTRPTSIYSSHDGDEITRSSSIDSALTDSTEAFSAGTPDTLVPDDEAGTPLYPMLLGNESNEPPALPAKNRRSRQERPNSSGYKVPIFIQPQNYDNLGTAKSDSETQLNQLKTPTPGEEAVPSPPVRSDSSDYLVPTELRNSIDGSIASGEPGSRDSGRFSASDNESKASSLGTNSISQPTPEPLYAKIQGKQKRTAPAPPGSPDPEDSDSSFLDTLPRDPPPPPPPPSTKDKGLVVDFPRNQAPNIYSQAPKKQVPNAYSRGDKPERPKAPQVSPEKVLGSSNKGQAPRLNGESVRPKTADSSAKMNLDKSVSPPKKFSQSVKVLPSDPAPLAPSPRTSAPVRKESLSSKSKPCAPVPSKSPAKTSVLKQVTAKMSPPSRKKSKGQLEKDVPLQNSLSKKADGKGKKDSDASEASGSPARTIAPLPPNSPLANRKGLNLLDDTITGGPASQKKESKKIKMPWKRRNKRKEDGSPERKFNAEPVQKWLDEIQKMQIEDSKTNRNSLDRLDVINSYKGQPIQNVKINGDSNGSPLPMSPLARTDSKSKVDEVVKPRSSSDSSSSPVAKPRTNSNGKEHPVPRPRTSSAAKRQAPRPPNGVEEEERVEEEDDDDDDNDDDDFEYVTMLQKSDSSSPISRQRNGSEGDNGNVYENVGIQRQEDAPPNKPTRRACNRTTSFEDLPSQKRTAPKAPNESAPSTLDRLSMSDQDFGKLLLSEDDEDDPVHPPRRRVQSDLQSEATSTCSTPVKTATKPKPKCDQDGIRVYSDEVRVYSDDIRVFATGSTTASSKSSNSRSSNGKKSANIDNMEYLMASDLKLGDKASLHSFYRDDDSDEETGTCKMDAAVQCSLPIPSASSTGTTPKKVTVMNGVIDTMLEMNRRTLTTILAACKDKTPKKWWTNETNWGELIDREEPCWCDEETVIYAAFPKEKHNMPLPVMVSAKHTAIPMKGETDKIVQVTEFTKASIPPQPNLYTVHAVSSLNFAKSTSMNPNLYTSSSDLKVPTDIPAIVIDKPPIMSLSAFVKENQQYHLKHAEEYEEDVSLVLLQLCSAIHHLQRNQLSLQRVDIEHVHLAQRTGCEKQVILNHLLSRLHTGMSKDGKILATPEQINLRTGEFSLGVLTYELLHCPSPFATKESLIFQDYRASDLPAIPNRSKYSKFLHTIASQFLTKRRSERLTANQGALALQTMLWGPQLNHLPNLMQNPREMNQALQQWLMIAQAGVVNKVAEEAAVAGRQGVKFSLKYQMKCQFLSEVSVENLMEGMTLLYFKRC